MCACRYGIGAPIFLVMSLVGWWAYGDVSLTLSSAAACLLLVLTAWIEQST